MQLSEEEVDVIKVRILDEDVCGEHLLILQQTVAHRYDPETRVLDLSEFTNDSGACTWFGEALKAVSLCRHHDTFVRSVAHACKEWCNGGGAASGARTRVRCSRC